MIYALAHQKPVRCHKLAGDIILAEENRPDFDTRNYVPFSLQLLVWGFF